MTTDQIVVVIGAVLGAGGLGAVLAYMTARRNTSGQIANTTANMLWDEQREFRQAQQEEIVDLRARLLLVEQRGFVIDQDNRKCLDRADRLEADLRATKAILAAKIGEAAAQVSAAETKVQVAEQQSEIAELKKTNGGSL